MLAEYVRWLSRAEISEAIRVFEGAREAVRIGWIQGAYRIPHYINYLLEPVHVQHCLVGAVLEASLPGCSIGDLKPEQGKKLSLELRLLGMRLDDRGETDCNQIGWCPHGMLTNWNDWTGRAKIEVLQLIDETLDVLRAAQTPEVVIEEVGPVVEKAVALEVV